MGTRSLTYMYDEHSPDPFVCMYQQYDGYPSCVGLELAKFLNERTLVNGISSDEERQVANGMGCLAAQMIVEFKSEPGGTYIYPPILGQDCWQDYEYHIFPDRVAVMDPKEVIFSGSWAEFKTFCEKAD